MARFYSNENFPFPAVEELRRLGHDVVTMAEAGHAVPRVCRIRTFSPLEREARRCSIHAPHLVVAGHGVAGGIGGPSRGGPTFGLANEGVRDGE